MSRAPAREFPDPWAEIRLLGIRTLPGPSFWRRGPVTRVDIAPGSFDEISSAQVPGVTDALLAALPGLWEHRCSVGARGGFVTRLRQGTYAPHIVEHVALELQSVAGHSVGYGRARGGDRPGEYTVVLAHLHSAVGRLAAQHALEIVRRAFAGGLESVAEMIESLRSAAETPDPLPPPTGTISIAITGGHLASAVAAELRDRAPGREVVATPPSVGLIDGLPYRHASVALIADEDAGDVPERYRDRERSRQLLSVVSLALADNGFALVPASAWEMQRELRDDGLRVAIFSRETTVEPEAARLAHAVATVGDGQIRIQTGDEPVEHVPLRGSAPPEAQAAAVLASRLAAEAESNDAD